MEEEQIKENILPSLKNINLMELFPRILNKDEKDFKITPSEYVKEMSLSMEERHKKLVHTANIMKRGNKIYPPQFKVVPDIMIFQKFEARSTNILILEVKNVGKSLLPVKMHCPSSDYFSANFANTPLNKIAPGLSIEYEITFTPNELRDYSHFLIFTSKEHSFQVPIIAVGPRPVLDIPDQIILNPAPVKISTTKFIVVRNIGNAPAVFNFITQSKHFQASPAKGILAVQESMVLSILFESSKVKEVTDTLHLVLETGEKLTITLHGSAENVSIRLDKNSLVHEDTFIGLKRCKTVRVINSSSSVIKFSWKKNKSQEEDLAIIESMKDKYKELTEMEILKDVKAIYYGLGNAERHKISCERILQDELKLLEKEEFKFVHQEFSIIPESGEVWPKGSVEIMISFEPKTCGLISAEAFLEVSGKDSRLPLKIKGIGIGPNIILNIQTLDIDFIYLCSLHKYEVTVENKGDIPGTIQYVPEPLVFGGKADVTPISHYLEPGKLGSFVISFTSNKLGDFTEKLKFVIKESKEKIHLVFKGKVDCPSLHFDLKQINFGTVPFGFSKSREVTLKNLSMVPVLFSLKVSPDGEIPSKSYEQFARYPIKPALPKNPKEFHINPEESVVEPFSSKKVTIILTPNKTGYFQKQLIADMWNSESGTASCPIFYEVNVPRMFADPEEISIPFCFINSPYMRSITLKNSSSVHGFFYILPVDPHTRASITCSANIPQGVLSPYESLKIDLAVITSELGRQLFSVNMLVFGSEAPQKICEISCVGQGPVVTVKPNSLDWGDLPLIQLSEKELEFSNESPIPATLELQMAKPNSFWKVDLPYLNISPGESVKVCVSLMLNDKGKFKDTLKINIHNGKSFSVHLEANGVGSSLKIQPCLNPLYDLGMLFSHKIYYFNISIENRGTKPCNIVFSPFPAYKTFANAKFVIPQESMFKFEPTKLDILPGEEATVIAQAYSKSAGKFSELFYCFSGSGKSNKKLNFKFEVRAEFSEPTVCFDKDGIRFWNNMGSIENEAKVNDSVCLINHSVLPIEVELVTTHPFSMLTPNGEYAQFFELTLDGLEVRQLELKFLSQPDPNKKCKTYKGKLTAVLKNYSKSNTVSLTGEVNYPNVVARPNNIDFGYIIAGMNYCKSISLINISPLTVHYCIKWDETASQMTWAQKIAQTESQTSEESEQKSVCDFDQRSEQAARLEEEPTPNDTGTDDRSQQVLIMPEKPVLRMPEVQVSDTDLRETLFLMARNCYNCDTEFVEAFKRAIASTEGGEAQLKFSNVCDIIPFYGKLDPYDCQILTIRFFSKHPVGAHLTALIDVLSGPTEVLTVDAMSTEIDFQLNSTELDFGRQLFCETANQILKVHNSSCLTLHFQVDSGNKKSRELNDNFLTGRGLMTANPESGVMNPQQTAEVVVRYHPGVPGKFEDSLELQIAFLEPILVKIKGDGVFPQVYLSLPRPDIFNVQPVLCYMAVASITPDWILTNFVQRETAIKPYRSRESHINTGLEGNPEEEGEKWEILDSFECLPTEIDIYLAIERTLAYNLLRQNSENSTTFAVYARTIPEFLVPAYTLDFGVCMIGHHVEQEVTVTNFGPLPVVFHGVYTTKLKEDGITVRMKKRNELSIGSSLPFTVSFLPKKAKYKKKYEKLETVFHFEVYQGPKVPIKILAEISYPYIIASMPVIEFAEVVCGCCKITSLRLHNPGLITAKWIAFIKQDTGENLKEKNSSILKDEKTMFHLCHYSGTLNPDEYCTLEVYFKPEFEGPFSGILCIAVSHSLTELKILLLGSGIEPRLYLSKNVLKFKPSLPFPNKSPLTDKIFTVENPCSFPIEFYFPDFDEQIYEEEKIIRAVTLYYDTNECLFPIRRPGEGLPPEIIDFYNMLLDNLNSKYMDEEREKIFAERERESLEDNLSSGFSFEDDPSLGTSQNVDRKKKKLRKVSRSRTSIETSRDVVGGTSGFREPIVLSIFETKTSEEIDEMMEDYIRSIRNTEPRYDPLRDALKSITPPPKEEEYKEGILIIIHGAPYTNSIQMANQVATFVNMPALNIDRIVLEEAALERCEAGFLAKELIERAYFDYFDVDETKEGENYVGEEEEEEDVFRPAFERNFEEIQRKFNALVELRENLISARGKNIRSASTKSETPRKTEKDKTPLKNQMNVNAPIANITEDIVAEILKFRLALEVGEGVVIEKLQSTLISPCTNALTTILKAAGNLKDIIVIFFLSNYAQYQQHFTSRLQEEELAKFLLQQEVLRILEEEPEEVFENLSLTPEEAESLRRFFLSQRQESQTAYEKQRDSFYESERQKRRLQNPGIRMNVSPLNLPSTSTPVGGKKGKESEKNTGKGTKTSDTSNRRSQSDRKSANYKQESAETEFLSFEASFVEMRRIIGSWDQRIGAVTIDSTPEVKTKKGQTPRKIESSPTNTHSQPRGIFLWLVDVSKPNGNSVLACCNFLKTVIEGKKAPEERDSWPLLSAKSMTLSVVSAPQKRVRFPVQQIFSISATENTMMGEDYCEDSGEFGAPMPPLLSAKLNRSASSISFKSKRKVAGASKRGRTDSRMSIDLRCHRSRRGISSAGVHENQIKPRWILQPQEMQHYLVKFYPTQIGFWEHNYVMSIVNWPHLNMVRCFGNCDIPRLDMNPEVVFCTVEYQKPLLSIFKPAYYSSMNAYDFGDIITTQLNEGNSSKKSVSLKLANISHLPVDVTVIFGESGMTDEPNGSEFMTIQPDKLWINPGAMKTLTVTVSPGRNGSFLETMLFIVKDNPKVEKVQMKFEGVRAKVSIQPELIDFDRILLHRKDFRNVILMNGNSIPLHFALKGLEDFPAHFTFSKTSGFIEPLENVTIEIGYKAVEVEIIERKPVVIQVFDDVESSNLVQELTFDVKVEAFDAALDVTFSSADEDHVDFGDIRVENHYTKELSLKNVGKYQIGYKIRINSSLLNETDTLELLPKDGKLLPGKQQLIIVTLKVESEVSWNRVEFFRLELMEPSFADEMIATIPIRMSATSHFSRYELQPSDQFNFGHIVVGSPKINSLQLVNTGHFSLSYFIESKHSLSSPEASGEPTKKSSKVSASSKEKVKKPVDSVLKVGNFEISPCSGTVNAGQTMTITVSCFPYEVKRYKEKVVVFVSETHPHFKNGNLLTIIAESCLPVVEIHDYRNVFREHFFCSDEANLSAKLKTGTFTLYTTNNNLFSFKNICVNKTAEARLHFQNPGPIDCVMTASTGPPADDERSITTLPLDASQYFSVTPERLIIDPYSSGCFSINFKPDALEVYKAQVTFTLEMPHGFEDVLQVYNLWGNGILPQIEITEPNIRTAEGQALVHFPPVSLGRSCCSSIAFSNVGISDCKVVMELYKCQNGIFTITPKPGTETTLRVWELTKPIDHTVLVSLTPGQVAEFEVKFTPQEVQVYNSQIKLFIVDNPFENWCFRLSGEVFFEEVVIEKIRTALPFLENTGYDDKPSAPVNVGQYYINLGYCYVKKKSKAVLRLTNRTERSFFKFEWEEVPSISITPHVGHLYPNSYKEILFVFYPEEPMELEDITISCFLNKIILRNPPELSWDSRLIINERQSDSDSQTPRMQDKNSSSARISDEPPHELIPESSTTLNVFVSAVADYTRLACEINRIFFTETFMFQTRVYPLVLNNPGNVVLEYKLSLKSVTCLPLKEDKTSQVNEASLSNIQPSTSRPFSAQPPSTRSGRRTNAVSRCDKRPRPLTSVIVVDLTGSSTESEYEKAPGKPPEQEKPAAYNPFTIENPMGRILPKESVTCDIAFSPMDINEYKASITIQVPNLHPECELPEIQVTASSVMPYCHFEIPESDYLESGRRDYTRPGPIGYAPGVPLHPDTKTIETKVIGLDVVVPIKFHVINPTQEDYTFSWINTTQTQLGVVSPFLCYTTDGQIQAGRQQLMTFKFVSQSIGITESFWTFSVPKYGIETPFLLVGDVREPGVYLLSNHITMTPTFIQCSTYATMTLVNHEDVPAEFYFLIQSLFCEGHLNDLKTEPFCGTIPPHSEFPVRLKFTGKTAGETLFNVKCQVKNKKEPLSLSVEVLTFAVQFSLTLDNPKKGTSYPEFNKKNDLDFGSDMSINFPETMTVTFTNISKTSLYYKWEYNVDVLEMRNCKLKFSPKSASVPALSRATCEITLVFLKKSSLSDFPVMLNVRLGPVINFYLSGTATAPHWEFSFSNYDFGNCFVQQKDICFYEKSLTVRNRDTADLVLECALPNPSAFSFTLPNNVIHPNKDMRIQIHFHPKDSILYEEVMKLIINGNHERYVLLRGRGILFKVMLTDAEDKTISLGAVKLGKTHTRKFSLVNKSYGTATVLVGFSDQLPVRSAHLVKPEKNPIDLSQHHRLTGILGISPSTVFSIPSQGVQTLTITYTPRERGPTFTETVYIQHQEKIEPVCVVTGCCLGAELSLDRKFLNFGAVTEGCTSCLKLKLINVGNIGASFEWDVKNLTEYSISPASGYCFPELDVTIRVTFSPTEVQNCIKRSVECKLYISEDDTHPSLHLDLIGDCTATPEPLETLWFECFVRKTDTRNVEIENTSGSEWQLMPVIMGEYFKGFETLIIPALSSASYKVDYCPLVMADYENFHEGSVFFKLPNGHAILYQLKGVSLPPEPEESIEREVPCKTKYVELLKVKNWLQYPQRFKVTIFCLDNKCDPATTCNGFEYLEVPGTAQRQYSLNFFAYNVGYHKYHVKFSNEETQEYIWYEIGFNVIMCGPLEVITLKSGVRQTCFHQLKLENPLKKTVEYELEASTREIYFDCPAYEVPPEQTMYVTLSFTPIHPGEKNEKLTASCPELGIFPRELRLFAADVLPEPPRTFETPLGTSLVQQIPIVNLSWQNAILHCKVDSDEFSVSEQATVPEGQTKNINVTYEPSDIGSTTATLFVQSEEAGNFIFPLVGMCVKPLAKGPFTLKPGSGVNIIFKNVFKKPKEFHMYVDNPAFELKSSQEVFSPKEENKIYVGMQKMKYLERRAEDEEMEIKPNFPVAGQLVVECFNPYVKWQFYLKGILET